MRTTTVPGKEAAGTCISQERLLSCHPCGLGNGHISAVFRRDYGVSCWSKSGLV